MLDQDSPRIKTLLSEELKVSSYKPRELSKIDAAIFRELIFSKRVLAVFPKDPSRKIHFFEPSSSSVLEKTLSFSLQVGQQKVDLSIEIKPETPLAQRLHEVGGLESLPEEFRAALMTFVSREIIDALEYLFELPVKSWDGAKMEEEKVEKKELSFEVLNAKAICEARASMTLSLSLLERVLAVAKAVPMVQNYSFPGELLQGEVLIGQATLSAEDWKNLVPGDLIIIQEPSALATGQGRCLIKKSGIFPMMLKAGSFKSLILPLAKIFPTGMHPLPPAPENLSSTTLEINSQDQKENTFLSSIPLELNFSAGVISLTIEETLQFIKTNSIQKPFSVSRPLKIFIQENAVGAGELVEINGRYAVVVTQL